MKKFLFTSLATFVTLAMIPVTYTSKVAATSEECRIFEDTFTEDYGYGYHWTNPNPGVQEVTHEISSNQLKLSYGDFGSIQTPATVMYGPEFKNQSLITTFSIKDVYYPSSDMAYLATYYMNDPHTTNKFWAEFTIHSWKNDNNWNTSISFTVYVDGVQLNESSRILNTSPENLKFIMVKNDKYNFVKGYYQYTNGGHFEELGKVYTPSTSSKPENLSVNLFTTAGSGLTVNYDNLVVKKPNCE